MGLFIMGGILLESGHAYRTTHIQHHRLFPHHDDPKGDPARMSFRLVLHGAIFLPRLWLWAVRKNAGRRDQLIWLIAEAAWAILAVLADCNLTLPSVPRSLGLRDARDLGSWVYPLLTVHLPHRNYGQTPLTQTHTLRGWFIPKLFLELTYHLEHHLYPQVPSHNLTKLSQRLDPHFAQLESCRPGCHKATKLDALARARLLPNLSVAVANRTTGA